MFDFFHIFATFAGGYNEQGLREWREAGVFEEVWRHGLSQILCLQFLALSFSRFDSTSELRCAVVPSTKYATIAYVSTARSFHPSSEPTILLFLPLMITL